MRKRLMLDAPVRKLVDDLIAEVRKTAQEPKIQDDADKYGTPVYVTAESAGSEWFVEYMDGYVYVYNRDMLVEQYDPE